MAKYLVMFIVDEEDVNDKYISLEGGKEGLSRRLNEVSRREIMLGAIALGDFMAERKADGK